MHDCRSTRDVDTMLKSTSFPLFPSPPLLLLDLNNMDIARELIDDGYKAQKYRAAYANPAFRIRPPNIDALATDSTLLPPKPVKNTAGRPKGVRKRKRVPSNGEFHTSSRYNTRMLAPAGSAAASSAAGTAGPSLSQPAPSQES